MTESNDDELSMNQMRDLAFKSFEQSVRFLAISNGGGAIATIAVFSATAKSCEIDAGILALPLTTFLLGIFFCQLLAISANQRALAILASHTGEQKKNLTNSVRVYIDKHSDIYGILATIAFFLGCLFGVCIIAVA